MGLTEKERKTFDRYARPLLSNGEVLKMKRFPQHGRVSCLEHSVSVARFSFWMCRRLHMPADLQSLVRGALLHDFFLYDWHCEHRDAGLHGFTHPRTALKNADRLFSLNDRERDIILRHMWPLTPHPPRCREAFVVCLADKCCSLRETLFCRR